MSHRIGGSYQEIMRFEIIPNLDVDKEYFVVIILTEGN